MQNRKGEYIDYKNCLEAAGVKVLEYQSFGSYQGTWLAFVEVNGQKGIIEGSYGSCSGCDSCQAEFDEWDQPQEKDGKYYKDYGDEEISKEEYDKYWDNIDEKMKNFGEYYTKTGLLTKEHYQNKLNSVNEDDWFSDEEKEYCEWAISRNW